MMMPLTEVEKQEEKEIQKEEKARELDNHKSCFWWVPLVDIN